MPVNRSSMCRLRFGLLVAILGLVGTFASHQAQAQDYPNKPIRFVVSSPAGGVVDIRARKFGQRIGELLKQPIVIENRPGATTTIGAEYVAKSAPDGYTALFGGNTEVVVAPALGMAIRYDPVKDFTPVAQFTLGYPLLVVHAGLGVKTLPELIAWTKARSDGVLCATSGHGSGQHFSCELLARSANINVRSVPYKGTGPALLDTAGGQMHIAVGYLAEVEKQYIATGKVIPLAALAPKRLPRFPNVHKATSEMESMIHHFKLVMEGPRPPVGECYVPVESPKGEKGYYLVSDGTAKPVRWRVRPPSFVNLSAIPRMVEGHLLSDVIAINASIDIVMGEIDR